MAHDYSGAIPPTRLVDCSYSAYKRPRLVPSESHQRSWWLEFGHFSPRSGRECVAQGKSAQPWVSMRLLTLAHAVGDRRSYRYGMCAKLLPPAARA